MRPHKGFTLIELLVVIAIIGLLSSVVLAAMGAARARANDVATASLFRQIQTALQIYWTGNGTYPGNVSHYYSASCGGTPAWTDVFNSSFTQMNVPSNLPAGCMVYSKVPGTAWRCYPHASDNSNPIVPGDYHYLLVMPVSQNSSLSYEDYPRYQSSNYQRCVFGPRR